jgi:hypothetical protein
MPQAEPRPQISRNYPNGARANLGSGATTRYTFRVVLLTTASSVKPSDLQSRLPILQHHLASNFLNMVSRKRLPTDPLLPRKSARLALTASGGGDSSGPSKTATPRPGGDDSSGPSKTATTRPGGDDSSGQKDSSQAKNLSGSALVQEVAKIVENKEDNPELMILKLMRRYSFDLSLLQKLLRRKSNQPQVA